MAAEPGSIAVFFGLDGGALKPLHDSDPMQKLRASITGAPDLVRNFATDSVADSLVSALNAPLMDVFSRGWKTLGDLHKYCDQSIYPAGQVNNYALTEHVISWTHKPRLRVLLDGKPCGPEIAFDVALKLTIQAASLEILDARIMKAATGSVQGSGSIVCAGNTLVERKTSAHAVPGKFSFGDGILIGKPYHCAAKV
jgi:hypothetical protein